MTTGAARIPRIGAVGLISWDHVIEVDRYPALGGYAVVTSTLESVGGTTANSAAAARRLGADVTIAGIIGADTAGQAIRDHFDAIGIDATGVAVDLASATDASTVIVERGGGERSILWHQGARIARGDRLDIDGLFGSDVMILDTDDLPLRRFLSDLPAHTRPNARLLGPLTFLSGVGAPDALEIALRHDIVVGNEREFTELTGLPDPDTALEQIRSRLRGSNARLLVMTRGAAGSTAATADRVVATPGFDVRCRDATGAGDAFVGGLAFGLASRWTLDDTLRLANAVGALATTALGPQSGHPSLREACMLAHLDLASSMTG